MDLTLYPVNSQVLISTILLIQSRVRKLWFVGHIRSAAHFLSVKCDWETITLVYYIWSKTLSHCNNRAE